MDLRGIEGFGQAGRKLVPANADDAFALSPIAWTATDSPARSAAVMSRRSLSSGVT